MGSVHFSLSRYSFGTDAMSHGQSRILRDPDFIMKGLLCAAHNRNAPGAVADFDPAQFFARFYIDDGDVV